MGNWRQNLASLIRERGLRMKHLSEAAGLSETQIRDWLKRDREPGVDSFARTAAALGLSIGELYDGSETFVRKVPIVGAVSGGEGWSPIDDGGMGDVEFTVPGEAVALLVRGDSMVPVYRPGDLIVGQKRSGATLHEAIGHDCIIVTESGDRYVKFLQRGTARGLFTLRSYNPAAKDIESVRVEWAAPITWIRRFV